MATSEAKSDKQSHLFAVRSILFLAASNSRAIARAGVAGAGRVVSRSRAAGKAEDKAAARDAALEAVADAWPMPVAIRINGVGSEWHVLDLDAVARSKTGYVV